MPKSLRIIQDKDEAKALKATDGVFCFSPSQVDTFRLCERKWGFSAIDRIYSPSGAGAALGSEVHALWEAYLEHGTMPPKSAAGKIAEATLAYLPLPGRVTVEGENFVLIEDEFGRMVMTCRIDFSIDDQGALSVDELGQMPPGWDLEVYPRENVPLIGDHKTTSSFDYAKAADDLVGLGTRDVPGDAQATCYGLVAALKHPTAPAIDLFWSYSRTKGARKALPVRARLTLTDLQRSLSFLWQDVEKMRSLKRTASSANQLSPNMNACDAFGGCPHRSRCEISNEEKLSNMSDALAAMLGLSGAAPAAAPAPTFAPTPAPAASIYSLARTPAPDPMLAPPAPAPTPAPVIAPPAPVVPAVDYEKIGRDFFAAGQVPTADRCGEHTAAILQVFNRLTAAANPLPPDAPVVAPPVAAPVVAPPVTVTETAAEKSRRERKPKDPRKLLGDALDAAREAEDFALVSKIASVLAG